MIWLETRMAIEVAAALNLSTKWEDAVLRRPPRLVVAISELWALVLEFAGCGGGICGRLMGEVFRQRRGVPSEARCSIRGEVFRQRRGVPSEARCSVRGEVFRQRRGATTLTLTLTTNRRDKTTPPQNTSSSLTLSSGLCQVSNTTQMTPRRLRSSPSSPTPCPRSCASDFAASNIRGTSHRLTPSICRQLLSM
jgi:hypothetical protein